ncbi:hypothetical protein [Arthrobacter sp. OAP107]|uniref:hypothetical protein n=1 Tax=Arthrobacter sp. OAP107 TaxID=3156445 RepID=UPI003392EC2A
MPELDLTSITAARAIVRVQAERVRATAVELSEARTDLVLAQNRGDLGAIMAAEDLIARLSSEKMAAQEARHRAIAEVGRLSEELLGLVSPETAVGSLSGEHPVLMLPVRLETRFFDSNKTLKVRIFPDQAHITAHDLALTADEEAGLRWYWTHRWPERATSAEPGGSEAGDRLADEAWSELCRRFRPGRAAFLVRTYPPKNLGEPADDNSPLPQWDGLPRRAQEFSEAARATLLPDRWCVLGFRRNPKGVHKEIFRVWGSAVPDSLAAGPSPDPGKPGETGGIPDEPGLRWLHDPTKAEEDGMLVTVTQNNVVAGVRLADGVDRLIALGVDWTLDPAQAAEAVQDHLASLADEGQLAFIPQGVPTNSSSTDRSGFSTSVGTAARAYAPHKVPAQLPPGSAAAVTAAALGLPEQALSAIPGAALREQAWHSALVDALWPATAGYYLTEMLDPVAKDPELNAALRNHARSYLRASGPIPTLRIGAQPYGVLPVVARARYNPGQGRRAAAGIHRVSEAFRTLAEPLVTQVPRLAHISSREDVDNTFLALLQRTPVPWSLTFRQLIGPVHRRYMSVYWDRLAAFQRDITATILAQLQCYELTLLSELTHDDRDHPLDVPMVLRPEPTPEDPKAVGTGYLAELLALISRDDGRTLLDGRTNSVALLEAFLAYAAVRELDAAGASVIRDGSQGLGLSKEFLNYINRTSDKIPYTLRVESTAVAPAAPGSSVPVPTTPAEFAATVIPALTGQQSISGLVAARLRSQLGKLDVVGAAPADPLHTLARFATDVTNLQEAPADQLEWAFRGTLDLYSTRLDAWITSLAADRLATNREGKPAGLHVGGWGVVEDLHPDGTTPESMGFVHAPSLAQAASLAVMRSARQSHRGEDGKVFDLDLSSKRVRQALAVIDGIAAGQRLAALLGYRFERSLQDRDVRLAQWILPLRLACPLRSDAPDGPGEQEPVEKIAARDVVDGVALLARWSTDGAGLLADAQVTAADRTAVGAVLDDLAALADAISDVLVAESVHQATAGNLDRSAAALAAHDRQGRPPQPEFVSTDRSGPQVLHRTGVWLPTDGTTPGSGWPEDLVSIAEPRLDRWLGRVLGRPSQWRIQAQLIRPPAEAVGLPLSIPLQAVGLDELGLSALATVLAARRPGVGQPSELELRFSAAFRAQVKAGQLEPLATDRLEILAPSMALLLDLAGWAADVVDAAPLKPADLTSASDVSAGAQTSAAAVDGDEAADRADRVREAASGLIHTLADALAALRAVVPAEIPVGGTPDSTEYRAVAAALTDVMVMAGPDALPQPEDGPDSAQLNLAARAQIILERMTAALAAADAILGASDEEILASSAQSGVAGSTPSAPYGAASLGAPPAAGSASPASPQPETEPAQLLRARGVVRMLLGNGQPFLPVLRFIDPLPLAASLSDRSALTGSEPTALLTWLHRAALVRPALDPLAALLVHAEAGGSNVTAQLSLVQLPHRQGSRWIGLPFDAGPAPAHGAVGVVLHAPDGMDAAAGGAGLMVDAWTESIPAEKEITSVAFHYDAPGARAPQAMLLAVHPEPLPGPWDLGMLADSIHEAMDLAQLRTLGSKELASFATFLPALFLPDNYTRDVPGIRLRELLEQVAKMKAGGLVRDHILGKMVK